MSIFELAPRFMALFQGLDIAFGTGAGRWVKRPPTLEDYVKHLEGVGPGIGIAPLRPDNTVLFAAIDLDEPDFAAAVEMQGYLPGSSFVERSRSGNAHVWVFFEEPIEAWLPMAVLKEATLVAGKPHVEIFPKNHDFARVRFGNYINLPYHGTERPVLLNDYHGEVCDRTLEDFLDSAEEMRNDPKDWYRRAAHFQLVSPSQRKRSHEFGDQETLHICATHVISGDAGPITDGHKQVVFFNLAKMLTNWNGVDHDDVVDILRSVNADQGRDSINDSELLRLLGNAERGGYTSTGCDDPVFAPFAHPDCPIANPRSTA